MIPDDRPSRTPFVRSLLDSAPEPARTASSTPSRGQPHTFAIEGMDLADSPFGAPGRFRTCDLKIRKVSHADIACNTGISGSPRLILASVARNSVILKVSDTVSDAASRRSLPIRPARADHRNTPGVPYLTLYVYSFGVSSPRCPARSPSGHHPGATPAFQESSARGYPYLIALCMYPFLSAAG